MNVALLVLAGGAVASMLLDEGYLFEDRGDRENDTVTGSAVLIRMISFVFHGAQGFTKHESDAKRVLVSLLRRRGQEFPI